MSHFTVLVIGPSPKTQLAPYQENNMGNCPPEYLKFISVEEENLNDYQTHSASCFIDPSGKPYSKYDKRFEVAGDSPFSGSMYKCPVGWTEGEVPFTTLYPSFEEYMSDYCGDEARDEKEGKYGYWENPNAKWDWYELGGRWTGFFKLNNGSGGSTGRPGLMTPSPKPGFADAAFKRCIDFPYMQNEAALRAAKEYDEAMKIFGDAPPNIPWKTIGPENNYSKESRDMYWAQPRCLAWSEEQKRDFKNFPFGFHSSPDDFLITKEKFIENARRGAITTHAA